jgi:hypothetical protein
VGMGGWTGSLAGRTLSQILTTSRDTSN